MPEVQDGVLGQKKARRKHWKYGHWEGKQKEYDKWYHSTIGKHERKLRPGYQRQLDAQKDKWKNDPEWRQRHSESVRNRRNTRTRYWIFDRYGITHEEYEKMFSDQFGACYICGGINGSGKRKALVVDHDHVTGKVRKLLCGRCNMLVGIVESPTMLLSGIFKYLTEHCPGVSKLLAEAKNNAENAE